MRPLMTYEVILHKIQNVRLYNGSTFINFRQNHLINECTIERKNLKSQCPEITFFVRYRSMFVLNKKNCTYLLAKHKLHI